MTAIADNGSGQSSHFLAEEIIFAHRIINVLVEGASTTYGGGLKG